jgi:septum site-determining protein MinC
MAIVIKGITVPSLLIKLDKTKTVDENITELEEKLSSTFFKGSLVVVDTNDIYLSEEDKRRIEETLEKAQYKVLGLSCIQQHKK